MNRIQKIQEDIYKHGSIPTLDEIDVVAAWVVAMIVIVSLALLP